MTLIRGTKKDRSAEYLIGVVTLILVFIMASRIPVDTDLWWHLRAGQQTWQSGQVLTSDIFSYTRYGSTWINHSWLSEVALYLLFNWGGFLAMGVLVASMATLSMTLVYLQMEGPAILRPFILVCAGVLAAFVWSPRPQIFSLVLLSVVCYLLYLYKWKKRNYLWLLIPIFILWSNLHGGYALGFILLAASIIGEILNHILGFESTEIISRKGILRLTFWTGISAIAVLINPNGISIWLVPFQTVGVTNLQMYIAEWASPNFHVLGEQVFIWLLFGGMIAMGFSERRLDASDLVVFLVFAYMTLLAQRNFGPFAIISPPIISRYLWPALTNWWGRFRPKMPQSFGVILTFLQSKGATKPPPAYIRHSLNLAIVVLLTTVAIFKLYLSAYPGIITTTIDEQYPIGAIAWIQANHPAGNLLNSYDWGGYLDWSLRDYPVFLDGRTDLFNDEIIGQWVDVINAANNWQMILNKWKVNLILLEPGRPVVQLLSMNGWKLLYADQEAVVYGR